MLKEFQAVKAPQETKETLAWLAQLAFLEWLDQEASKEIEAFEDHLDPREMQVCLVMLVAVVILAAKVTRA